MKLKTENENKKTIEIKINGRINTVINLYLPSFFEREKTSIKILQGNNYQGLPFY